MTVRDSKISTVAIGGIKPSNVQRVLHQSHGKRKGLDGVAVVSAIIDSEDPHAAASNLRKLIASPSPFGAYLLDGIKKVGDPKSMLSQVLPVVKKVGQNNPLCHNMTNMVVQNFAANVALAM